DLLAAEELAAAAGTTGTAWTSTGTAARASGTATWTTSGGALCRACFGCFYLVLIRHLVSSSFSWLSGLKLRRREAVSGRRDHRGATETRRTKRWPEPLQWPRRPVHGQLPQALPR